MSRARLTYGNVVATLALFLALSGGVVLAANKITSKQIGKGAVKNKNLAKNAVKAKNLAKKAVTAPKLANGAVKNAAIADGAVNFAKLAPGTNVVASATGGPAAANQSGLVNVPLSPPLTVTPASGQLLTLNMEARGTLTETGGERCQLEVLPTVNGTPLLAGELLTLYSPESPAKPPFGSGAPVSDAGFPIGIGQPGTPQSIGVVIFGDPEHCAAGSRLDQVTAVVTQEK